MAAPYYGALTRANRAPGGICDWSLSIGVLVGKVRGLDPGILILLRAPECFPERLLSAERYVL